MPRDVFWMAKLMVKHFKEMMFVSFFFLFFSRTMEALTKPGQDFASHGTNEKAI